MGLGAFAKVEEEKKKSEPRQHVAGTAHAVADEGEVRQAGAGEDESRSDQAGGTRVKLLQDFVAKRQGDKNLASGAEKGEGVVGEGIAIDGHRVTQRAVEPGDAMAEEKKWKP